MLLDPTERHVDPFLFPARIRTMKEPILALAIHEKCEGGGDVVGVVTPLVGGVAQAFHDDRVVELRVQLGVQEVEGKDREGQVEVERERRVKEVRPWI